MNNSPAEDNPVNIHTLCLSQIHDLALNHLNKREKAELEPHLNECDSCFMALEDARAYFESIKREGAALRTDPIVPPRNKTNDAGQESLELRNASKLSWSSFIGTMLTIFVIWYVYWTACGLYRNGYKHGFNDATTSKENSK